MNALGLTIGLAVAACLILMIAYNVARILGDVLTVLSGVS